MSLSIFSPMHYIKISLIVLSLFISWPFYLARLQTLDGAGSHVLYAALFGGLAVAVLITSFIRNSYVRILWAVALTASFVFYESVQRIFGEALTYSTFYTLMAARGFLGDSLMQFRGSIVEASLIGLPLFLGLVLPARRSSSERLDLRPAVPVLALCLLSALLFARNGHGAGGLPSVFTPIAYLGLYAYQESTAVDGERESVRIKHLTPPGSDIVLIMDESVRGDYLDINHPNGVPTPLNQAQEGIRVSNFGLAASATNCSDGTNKILRFGGGRDNFLEYIAVKPSIWSYARAAGMRAVYVDAQRTGGRLHNRMLEDELAEIDEHVQFDGVPPLLRDMSVANEILKRSVNGVVEFIYVNKIGAHFPVHDKYPGTHEIYRPTLRRGKFADVTDTGERRQYFDGNWQRYRNSYKNTLSWNTGAFFERLFAEEGATDDAIIFYTADHGQTFHERGEAGLNTHCSPSPSMEEGVVPLVVITSDRYRDHDFDAWARHHHDQSSHYQIFGSILELMGFDTSAVQAVYGSSLMSEDRVPYSFNYDFHGNRFGDRSKWKSIDVERLQGP